MVGTAHFVNRFRTLPFPCVPWSQEAKRLLRQPLPCPANAGFGGFSGFETTKKLKNLIHPIDRYIVVVVIRYCATTERTNRWGPRRTAPLYAEERRPVYILTWRGNDA